MKKFHVKITDKKTNQVLEDVEIMAVTQKYLLNIYTPKYRFHPNVVKIEINRVQRKPGIQVDLEDMIKEVESESNPQ